jgi:predicted lysophospholipase L1 biosynthesis ABC-type transport system permease subunit
MLYLFVLAVALLAPWINHAAARLLAPVLRRVWGASGYLASANLRANARGMATVLTALVLAVGFGGSVWFLQDNLERQTVAQSRDGMLAQRAVISAAGLPDTAVEQVRRVRGVQAATAVRHTSVIVKVFDGAESVAARAVDQDGAAATMDLDVAAGSLAGRYPTSTVVPASALTGQLAEDLAISAWLNKLLIGVMVGYAALAAANTMVVAALARRRELAVLRLAGVTRRQVKNMVHAEQAGLLGVALAIGAAIAAVTLAAVVNAVTGSPIPYVPPLGWVAVLGGASVLALTTTVLPVGRLLRASPIENIGLRE